MKQNVPILLKSHELGLASKRSKEYAVFMTAKEGLEYKLVEHSISNLQKKWAMMRFIKSTVTISELIQPDW